MSIESPLDRSQEPTEQDLILPDDAHNRELVANVHPPAWRNPDPSGRYNRAERDLRPGVILRKLTQGSRSETGSTATARALSVVSTCRKQGHDVLDYLTEALTCFWRGIPPPLLLPPG